MSELAFYKIAKEQSLRIAELEAELKALREALEVLAKLGNGDHYGNSDGNRIAQKALLEADDD